MKLMLAVSHFSTREPCSLSGSTASVLQMSKLPGHFAKRGKHTACISLGRCVLIMS